MKYLGGVACCRRGPRPLRPNWTPQSLENLTNLILEEKNAHPAHSQSYLTVLAVCRLLNVNVLNVNFLLILSFELPTFDYLLVVSVNVSNAEQYHIAFYSGA